MRNLLLISASPEGDGGISKWTKYILEYSHLKNDVEIDLLSINRKRYNNSVFKFIADVYYYFHVVLRFVRMLKVKKYDIIHVSTSASLGLVRDIIIIYFSRKFETKVVIQYHFGRIENLKKKNNWEWKLLLKVANLADENIVIDRLSFNILMNAGCLNVNLIPNPLSETIIKLSNQYKNEIRDDNLFLFVGHVIETKGVFELIDACKSIENIKLVIIGSFHDEIRKVILNKLLDTNLENNVLFLGNVPLDNVVQYMSKAGLFILPTYTEGFPNVILESMVCRCPIISTSVGAIPEMLNIGGDDMCGICIEPRDVKALENAINYMRENTIEKKTYAYNAYVRVRQMYTIEKIWSLLCDIWLKNTM